ncbi:coatomer subunit zeta-2 [Trichechus manatus latirostris]|uniref:Coatomer subunit zeta n=1 Tax=Trichechus manatus latirostris TaxID=127582 RepID=A0A2Y9DNW1_TRIMA|nr:coatomer subunit zeta-2 [Trichechus manatus latirostris]
MQFSIKTSQEPNEFEKPDKVKDPGSTPRRCASLVRGRKKCARYPLLRSASAAAATAGPLDGVPASPPPPPAGLELPCLGFPPRALLPPHSEASPRGHPRNRAHNLVDESLVLEPSLYTIKAVFILDNDGRRLLAKYYDDTFPSTKEQMVFEKNVFNKTSRTDSEIAFFGGMTIVYKSSIDLFLYVVGSSHENELMLMAVLTCLFESLNHMLRKNVEKRWLLENMDGAFLVLDEIVDGGVILESDPQQVIQKVNFRADDGGLTEQSVAQVLQSAKEQIRWSLLK